MREYDEGWKAGRQAGAESRDLEVLDLVIARLQAQAVEIEELRVALNRLLLNYGAALPEGKKDQRSIAEARKLLGLDVLEIRRD